MSQPATHIAISLSATPELMDILVAQLSEAGFEGFEEKGNVLVAYIPAQDFDETAVKQLLDGHGIAYTKESIAPVNWNAVWESNFQPVQVGGFCGIRAAFHPPFAPPPAYEIVITPKMSFGTGHHATTWSMIQLMQKLALEGKRVFDFGTGTGILAILAAKMGAAAVDAIDIDEWAVENTRENLAANNAELVKVWPAGALPESGGPYDVLLANINRNVLLNAMAGMRHLLAPGGILLLSGILQADEEIIRTAAIRQGLAPEKQVEKDNWLAMRLVAR